MARSHPTKVIAAVKALATADVNAHKIRDMLKAGDVPGVDAYEMPLRTIQEHAQNARRELDPLPDDELDAVNAIERMGLRVAMEEATRLRSKQARLKRQKKGGLARPDMATMEAAVKLAQAIRNDRARRPASNPDSARGGETKAERERAAPASILERVGESLNDSHARTPTRERANVYTRDRGTDDRPASPPPPTTRAHANAHAPREQASDETQTRDGGDNDTRHEDERRDSNGEKDDSKQSEAASNDDTTTVHHARTQG